MFAYIFLLIKYYIPYFIKNILESKQLINKLEEENKTKNLEIKRLENNLKNANEENHNLKVQRNEKIEQLKQTNKTLEKTTLNHDNLKAKNESLNDNFQNKIKNLEGTIKKLNSTISEKNEEIKLEKSKFKKITSKKKVHSKYTETEMKFGQDISTQTLNTKFEKSIHVKPSPKEMKNKETYMEDKFFLLLKDPLFVETNLLKTEMMRTRSNSFPSESNYRVKKASYVKKASSNEASWNSVNPESSVAEVLTLTRDISGFFSATASNLRRTDMIEDMMDYLLSLSGT